MERIAAETELEISATHKKVRALLSVPENVRDGCVERWKCTLKIEGLNRPVEQEIWGEDSMQALLLAAKGLDAILSNHNEPLEWGGVRGFTSLPLVYYPLLPGKERELKKMVQDYIDSIDSNGINP